MQNPKQQEFNDFAQLLLDLQRRQLFLLHLFTPKEFGEEILDRGALSEASMYSKAEQMLV